jgi:hypothetical protein
MVLSEAVTLFYSTRLTPVNYLLAGVSEVETNRDVAAVNIE